MEGYLRKYISNAVLANGASHIAVALAEIFEDNINAMIEFFCQLFNTHTTDAESPNCKWMIIHPEQTLFRIAFLKYARQLGCELENPADESLPVKDKTEAAGSDLGSPAVIKRRRLGVSADGLGANGHHTLLAAATRSTSADAVPAELTEQQKILSNAALFRVKYLDTKQFGEMTRREYKVMFSVRIVCALLVDPQSDLRRRCNCLSALPHILTTALLEASPKAGRLFLTNRLLTPAASDDLSTMSQIRCYECFSMERLEMLLTEDAADQLQQSRQLHAIFSRDAAGEALFKGSPLYNPDAPVLSSRPLDGDFLAITLFMYFRFRLSDLSLDAITTETLFRTLNNSLDDIRHYSAEKRNSSLFERLPQQHKADLVELTRQAPRAVARMLRVGDEFLGFIRRRTEQPSAATTPVPDCPEQRLLDCIYHHSRLLYHCKLRLSTLSDLRDRARGFTTVKGYSWVIADHVHTADVLRELERSLMVQQLNKARAFLGVWQRAAAFRPGPGVSKEDIDRSMLYLSHKHYDCRVRRVDFRACDQAAESAPGCRFEAVIQEEKNDPEKSWPKRYRLVYTVISDSQYTIVLFSSPIAHQRMCRAGLVETCRTPRSLKLVPLTPAIMREYSSVFGRYVTDEAKGVFGPAPAEVDDEYDGLIAAVKCMTELFCRAMTRPLRRLSQRVATLRLLPTDGLFTFYRRLHCLATRLMDGMVGFPFFRALDPADSLTDRRVPLRELHERMALVCDVFIGALALKARHTMHGSCLAKLQIHLASQGDSCRHIDLRRYIDSLAITLNSLNNKASGRISPDEQRRVVLYWYDAWNRRNQIDVNCGTRLQMLFAEKSDSRRLALISIMLYEFCMDEREDTALVNEVLFDIRIDYDWVMRRRITGSISSGGTAAADADSDDDGEEDGSDADSDADDDDDGSSSGGGGGGNNNNSPPAPNGKLPSEKFAQPLNMRPYPRFSKVGERNHGAIAEEEGSWLLNSEMIKEKQRTLYYGILRMHSNALLSSSMASYSTMFLFPPLDGHVQPSHARHCLPIVYHNGGSNSADGASTKLPAHTGEWRFETRDIIEPLSVDQDRKKLPALQRFEALGRLLLEVEWRLYVRPQAGEPRRSDASEFLCPWNVDADIMIRMQLNSRFPICCYATREDSSRCSTAQFVYADSALWLLNQGAARASTSVTSLASSLASSLPGTPRNHEQQSPLLVSGSASALSSSASAVPTQSPGGSGGATVSKPSASALQPPAPLAYSNINTLSQVYGSGYVQLVKKSTNLFVSGLLSFADAPLPAFIASKLPPDMLEMLSPSPLPARPAEYLPGLPLVLLEEDVVEASGTVGSAPTENSMLRPPLQLSCATVTTMMLPKEAAATTTALPVEEGRRYPKLPSVTVPAVRRPPGPTEDQKRMREEARARRALTDSMQSRPSWTDPIPRFDQAPEVSGRSPIVLKMFELSTRLLDRDRAEAEYYEQLSAKLQTLDEPEV